MIFTPTSGSCGDKSYTTELCVPDVSCGKKDKGQRPVINLKDLNKFVKTEHFNMEATRPFAAT